MRQLQWQLHAQLIDGPVFLPPGEMEARGPPGKPLRIVE